MSDESLLITNALICNENRVSAGDVLVRRGRIDTCFSPKADG